MARLADLTETQTRRLVHIYASLREHLKDEAEYDRTPEFAEPDEEEIDALVAVAFEAIGSIMRYTHPEEAAAIEADIAAQWAATRTAMREAWARDFPGEPSPYN